MAYIPKIPPFSTREKVLGRSLLGKELVTAVTEVTSDLSSRGESEGAPVVVAVHRLEIASLVRQWLRQECVSTQCCTSAVNSMQREFFRWARLNRDDGEFVDELRRQGFSANESGMLLPALALGADFFAALEYERDDISFPAKDGRNLKGEEVHMTMIIRAKQQNFEIPNEGEHLAVLADVVDLGEADTDFGPKDRLQFRWLVEQPGKDGKLLVVRQKPHNKSMHEKSNLRKDVKRILGRDPGDTFDVETLLGMNALLEIEHYSREGRTYANIAGIRQPAGVEILKLPEDFKRDVPAPKQRRARPIKPSYPNFHGVVVTDDDVPF